MRLVEVNLTVRYFCVEEPLSENNENRRGSFLRQRGLMGARVFISKQPPSAIEKSIDVTLAEMFTGEVI